VIVVDDGSTDSTPAVLQRFADQSPLKLLTFRQANAGPATARNRALRHTRAPLVVLIGDDILVAPEFVEQHLQAHEQNTSEKLFVLGFTRWDSNYQKLTPFMQWLEHVQFNYRDLEAGTKPDWRYFYTSNLSFKTKLLLDYPFDEAFPIQFEDMEMGYRLEQAAMLEMEYHREIVATHVHPTNFTNSVRRMQKIGYAEAYFVQQYPEAAPLFRRPVLKHRLYEFLASQPTLLHLATRAAARMLGDRKPSAIGSGLLMANHRRGWALHRQGLPSATEEGKKTA